MSSCDFTVGKFWDQWKMDDMKKHILHKINFDSPAKLRRLKSGCSINNLFTESTINWETRLDRSSGEQVKIPVDNALLAISMNASVLSVQEIHHHVAKM